VESHASSLHWLHTRATSSACWVGICAICRTVSCPHMSQSLSIFTGSDTASSSTTNPGLRRSSTQDYREALFTPPAAPSPRTPSQKRPSSILIPQPIWTRKPLPDLSDSPPRPLSSPLYRLEGRSGDIAVQTPPTSAGHKRPLPPSQPREPASEPLHKRRRIHTHPRHSLDRFGFSKSAQFRANEQPPSPLFFSSRNTRPQLPARFSSSEAAARMLSKAKEESGIKTVTLARGTFSGLSPSGPTGVASGRSSERSSLPSTTSPESRGGSDPLKLLGSVGIVELLEQDTRPTFIVDIGDLANYAPESSLQLLFANTALRLSVATWDLVAGSSSEHTSDESAVQATNRFRVWLLSPVHEVGTPDVNPSPVEHGGVIWSCYTLRKRLRVISGAVPASAAASITPASAPPEFATPSTSSAGPMSGNGMGASFPSATLPSEPQDYFGDTVVPDEHTSPNATSRSLRAHDGIDSSSDAGGLVQKPSHVNIQTIEDLSTFDNE
jgi:hypothetical protein